MRPLPTPLAVASQASRSLFAAVCARHWPTHLLNLLKCSTYSNAETNGLYTHRPATHATSLLLNQFPDCVQRLSASSLAPANRLVSVERFPSSNPLASHLLE